MGAIEMKRSMRGLLGLLVGLGLWGTTTAHAAPNLVRWPAVQPLTARTCTLQAKQTKLYQLNHATMHLTATGTAKLTTGWVRIGQVMVTQNGRLVTYWQVRNARLHRTSWVLADAVHVPGTSSKDIVTPKRAPMPVKTTFQRRVAITTAGTSRYLSLVGAGRYTQPRVIFHPTAAYLATMGVQNKPDTLLQQAGYRDHYHFKTALYLPQQLGTRNLGDPQSAAFSLNNRYLYVMYVDDQQPGQASQAGWVVRYDWQRLMALGAGRPGKMAMLRVAAAHQFDGKLTAFDRQVLAAIEVGPEFTAGHAQSLALNPRTNELWFISNAARNQNDTITRLNTQSLTPDARVVFTTGRGHLGDELAFDENGTAYYWTHASRLRTSKVDLYRGSIAATGVHFEAAAEGLANNPGFFAQSTGYDEATGKLYLVADESITSLPVVKWGHWTARQVGEANFAGQREFEGLVFMHGVDQGFLLTNRGTELMRMVVDKPA